MKTERMISIQAGEIMEKEQEQVIRHLEDQISTLLDKISTLEEQIQTLHQQRSSTHRTILAVFKLLEKSSR